MKRYHVALGVALTTAALLLLFSASALAATKPSVSLKTKPSSVTIGEALQLTGTVTHPKSGVKSVTLLRQVGTTWQSLTTAKLSSKHTFAVKVMLTPAGTWRLEAQYKVSGIKVRSKVVTVTVKAWTAVSAGWTHTLALKSDGTLWAWGDNGYGDLGLGNTGEKNSPTQVDPGSTWKAVSAGWDYTLAIKSDGTMWAWGENNDGQLGLGSADGNAHPSPTQVDPGTTWKAVSCGQYDTLAIKSDGTLWAWGYDTDGELGLGNTAEATSPRQVGGADTWASVSSGYGYTLALQSNGSLWGCGSDSRGELGLAATSGTYNTPTAIDAGISWAAVSVSAFDWYTMAIKSDGSLWACGHNDADQLGLGDTTDRATLTQVDPGSIWKAVSCGGGCTLAVKSDGSLWAWGSTTSGNLGLGSMDSTVATPTRVGMAGNWTSVSAGYEQTLALKSDGSLWAWGDNFYGDLGLGNTSNRDTPTEVGGGS